MIPIFTSQFFKHLLTLVDGVLTNENVIVMIFWTFGSSGVVFLRFENQTPSYDSEDIKLLFFIVLSKVNLHIERQGIIERSPEKLVLVEKSTQIAKCFMGSRIVTK